MYVRYTYRGLLLAISLSILMVSSLSFNVKQFFDIAQYKAAAVGTQMFLQNVVPQFAQLTYKSGSPTVVNLAETKCMAENIYFEAATQSLIGKIAVGQVVLNRMKNSNYPKTVCGVVKQKTGEICQFSWACEDTRVISNSPAWRQSQQVAYNLLSANPKNTVDITEGATHFHGLKVKPNWKGLHPTTKIDDHQFYRQ